MTLHAPGSIVTQVATPPRHQRAEGRVELVVERQSTRDYAKRAFQSGCGKVRMPRVHAGFGLEATLLNTSGGLTGGDQFFQSVSVKPGAAATLSTQAYEKIYRSSGGVARIETTLSVEAGAALHWLPQPTLVYEGGAMHRSTHIGLASGSEFLAVEGLILGRAAMGEALETGSLRDDWSIRVDGTLVFADFFRLEEPISVALAKSATFNGGSAVATLIVAGADLAERLQQLRKVIDNTGITAGASLIDQLIVVRLLANSGRSLSSALADLIAAIRKEPLPRVWSI